MVLLTSGCAATPSAIVPSDSAQEAPAISGSTIAWEDSRNAETDGTDIYTEDAVTLAKSLVAGGSGDQVEPAVSSSYFVWIDDGRLRAMDRSTGNVFNVANGAATQLDPALCGSVVVWSDSHNNSDIYARDLAGGSEIPVATSAAAEAYPACDAGRVVYMYAPTGDWASIRVYDLATGETRVVASDGWNDWRPAISGNRVVWQAWPNQPNTAEGIQIYGTTLNPDLSTGPDFVVTEGPGHQMAPTIDGSIVAWEDARNGNTQVWWRDLATTTPEQPAFSAQAGSQLAPAVSGRRLVYQGNATGVSLVWLANL